MLRTRLVTSLLAIPIVVAAAWFGEPWFTILITVVALRAVIEFYRLASATGASPLPYFGMLFAMLFVVGRNPDVVSWLEPHFDVAPIIPLLLTLTVALPMAWLVLRRRAGQTFTGWAWTVAGILYTGWLLGLVVSVFGQVGDLAESLLKRNAAAKDSGRVFPGHGGALDRIDSIVFAGIVVYYVVVWAIQ